MTPFLTQRPETLVFLALAIGLFALYVLGMGVGIGVALRPRMVG